MLPLDDGYCIRAKITGHDDITNIIHIRDIDGWDYSINWRDVLVLNNNRNGLITDQFENIKINDTGILYMTYKKIFFYKCNFHDTK